MKRNRFTDEQIIGLLKVHEAGTPVSELCRKHGASSAEFLRVADVGSQDQFVDALWNRNGLTCRAM